MERTPRKKIKCKYPGCDNWYYLYISKNKHFFVFPKDPVYHQLWRKICKIDDSANSQHYRVCEDHFVDTDFVNLRKEKLKVGVIPVPLPVDENYLAGLKQHNPILEVKEEPTDETDLESNLYQDVSISTIIKNEILSDSSLDHYYCLKSLEGINAEILEKLKTQVREMKQADRHCVLVFGESFFSHGFDYERVKEYISGYEDTDSIGQLANHGLIFMVRGIRKPWNQIVAYYCTGITVSAKNRILLIKEIISQLQASGLIVCGTVCDHSAINQWTFHQLCTEEHPRRSSFYFFVNGKPIVTIFDVRHLLVDTRDALEECKIEFAAGKLAKFVHILEAFALDQQRTFKALAKLKQDYFEDSSIEKNDFKVAAAQLSYSVASSIETYVMVKKMSPEAMSTAEFVKKMDDLFDSLNGSSPQVVEDSKPLNCALSFKSPHLEFWTNQLTEMCHWKLIDLSDVDVTSRYSFVKGWQTTMRAIMFMWEHLKNVNGFNYLSLRNLNQEPLEQIFLSVRRHGESETE